MLKEVLFFYSSGILIGLTPVYITFRLREIYRFQWMEFVVYVWISIMHTWKSNVFLFLRILMYA